jgi:hypothetical protein
MPSKPPNSRRWHNKHKERASEADLEKVRRFLQGPEGNLLLSLLTHEYENHAKTAIRLDCNQSPGLQSRSAGVAEFLDKMLEPADLFAMLEKEHQNVCQ